MKIQASSDSNVAAKEAAGFITRKARAAMSQSARFFRAIGGGRSRSQILQALADGLVPWPYLPSDELIVPGGDRDGNFAHPGKRFPERAPLPPEQIHAMQVEETNSDATATSYVRQLE